MTSLLAAVVLSVVLGAEPAAAARDVTPGPRAEGNAWVVEVRPSGPVPGGASGTVRVVVTARGNFHVNRDYPMSFRPGPGSTATFAGERVALSEGAERTPCREAPGEACTVSVPLRFGAAPAGETLLSGVVSFSVCNADRCLIERVPVSLVVPPR